MEGTIKFKGVEFDVEYDFEPEEAQVNYYPDGSGYPGCAACCSINEIKHKGDCFLEILDSNLDEIEEALLTQIMEPE